MINRNKYLTAACAAVMTLALTGCGAAGDTAETSAPEAVQSSEISEQSVSEALTESSIEETASHITYEEYNIASLKGPTTMGMVKLMDDSDKGLTANKYNVTIHATADEISAGIAAGTVDIANVPANLSSVLYKKTEGGIKIADVNTLGVLYVVSSGAEIASVEDLRGQTVYSTGKGTTPEYVFNYILRQNGLDPEKDLTVEYKSEASEAAALMAESEGAIAVLPQPFVTSAMMQNDSIGIRLSLTDEWNKVCETPFVTGVTVARNEVIDRNKDAFSTFMDEYSASVDFVNSNNEEAAALIAGYDIVKEPVALKALPYCNITFLRGNEMADAVKGYLNVLFEQEPKSVGGELPDDSIFYLG
ncbi:MAG: ABC transporter substrate-binding protein [Huintestinicola sp.]